MGSRMKEDERFERAIRSLLKLPDNRRCINCDNLGPQYVCTTFWTFVCINCSGIHREFSHRVKSVSMAKFTAEEVSALQAGGNERARQIYFKEWDPQQNAYPDCSNSYRLRNFIKNVYVDRKYSGESSGKPSSSRPTDTEGIDECKRVSTCSAGSRSPNYGDKSERSSYERTGALGKSGDRSFKFLYDERGSPRHARQSSRCGGLQKSPIRFEVVDDRFRDDGGVKRYEGRKLSSRESKGSKSLDLSNDRDRSNSPVVRPIRDLLGDNAPRLQVGDVPKVEESKDGDGAPCQNQTAASTGNLQDFNKTKVEQKKESPESLIDLLNDSEPFDPTSASKTRQLPPSNHVKSQSSSELPSAEKATQVPDANSLEALLFGLSVPSVGTGVGNIEVPGNNDISSTEPTCKSLAILEDQMSTPPTNIDAFTASTTNIPAQPSIADGSFNAQQTVATAVTPNNQLQPWMVSTAPNTQGPFGATVEQSSHDVSNLAHGTLPGVGSEPHPEETKSSGKKEIPEDLFTGSFSSVPPQAHGWQSGLPHAMGYGMQYYHNPMNFGAFPYSAKPTNPFDLSSETNPMLASQFPSMASMQGALPNVSVPRGYSHSSGLMGPQSPLYAAVMAPRSPSFASTVSPGAYGAQHAQMNMQSSRAQGTVAFSNDGNSFNPTTAMHQASNGYLSPTNPNNFPSRGNPFG